MKLLNPHIDSIFEFMHSPIRNYGIPGLTSYLVGKPSASGVTRVFHSTREHQEPIAPHSHRFNFTCVVLRGSVKNRLWYKDNHGDEYETSKQVYNGTPGQYNTSATEVCKWAYTDLVYTDGDCYSMHADEVHSIYFSKDALVLFFEGPQNTNESIFLQPHIEGETINTFKIEPWMFRKDD